MPSHPRGAGLPLLRWRGRLYILRAGKYTELGGRLLLSLSLSLSPCSKLMSFPSSELPRLHGALTDMYAETRGRHGILAAGCGRLSMARHCLYQRTWGSAWIAGGGRVVRIVKRRCCPHGITHRKASKVAPVQGQGPNLGKSCWLQGRGGSCGRVSAVQAAVLSSRERGFAPSGAHRRFVQCPQRVEEKSRRRGELSGPALTQWLTTGENMSDSPQRRDDCAAAEP